jgi:hypothetical protein
MNIILDRPVQNRKKFENNYSHRGGAKGYASTVSLSVCNGLNLLLILLMVSVPLLYFLYLRVSLLLIKSLELVLA